MRFLYATLRFKNSTKISIFSNWWLLKGSPTTFNSSSEKAGTMQPKQMGQTS